MHDTAFEMRMILGVVSKIAFQAAQIRLQSLDKSISHLQFSVLRALEYEGNLTLSELSRKFLLDPSTLVPSIDGLERKGLIRRERDPNDRRRIPLYLTEPGRQLVRDVSVVDDDDPLLHSLQQLGEDKAQHLLQLMRNLVQHLPDGDEKLRHIQSRLYKGDS